MSNPEPSIRVVVDPTNPGQFFACCGLLELADRLWPGAEGWFDSKDFCLRCDGTLLQILDAMVMRAPESVGTLENGLSVKPIIAPLRFAIGEGILVLDTWMRIGLDKGKPTPMGNSPWNFWSGQQTSGGIWNAVCVELKNQLPTIPANKLPQLFSHRILLSGRFGFDPGAAWDALDTGFSPNAQNLDVASSPAVELLAAVGIQRFKPTMLPGRQTFIYALWPIPLAPPVAACAAAAAPITSGLIQFQGQVVSRGQYAALGYSTPLLKGDSNG